ncbi:MAG: response regulator [Candidatus Manganitrophaceae bacterium]|nr:MAG: response regulator [Candidatus Manganitrophaceae bacterium]
MKQGKTEKTILIGEDHPDTLNILKLIFEHEGYPVDTSLDSETVLVKALHHKPSLILLDMMLPKIGGVEVCRKLKKDLSTSHIPIIIVTAKSDQEARAAAVSAGADGYVLKPFDPVVLVEKVNQVLGHSPFVPLAHNR